MIKIFICTALLASCLAFAGGRESGDGGGWTKLNAEALKSGKSEIAMTAFTISQNHLYDKRGNEIGYLDLTFVQGPSLVIAESGERLLFDSNMDAFRLLAVLGDSSSNGKVDLKINIRRHAITNIIVKNKN